MLFYLKSRSIALAGLFSSPLVWAQAVAVPQPELHPPVRLQPTLEFKSIFSGYQVHRDPVPVPWKKANEDVRSIGGWRAYAKESQPSRERDTPAEAAPGVKN